MSRFPVFPTTFLKRTLHQRKEQLVSPFFLGAVLSAWLFAGCQWIAVTYHAFGYPTTAAGESANVVTVGGRAFGTLADDGFEIVNLTHPVERQEVAPPAGSESVDDIAFADGFLFVLDARQPGHLSVFVLSDSARPVLTSGPVVVPVGPFSGVSAGNGRVIVSGGTSSLTLFNYDSEGRLSSEVASIDLGRGQPDVLVAPDGKRAFVSTHFFGPYFGLTTLEIGSDSAALMKRGEVDLDTYGFTDGGTKPANFPVEAALSQNTLFIAHAAGLGIISIENLADPKLVGVVDLGIKAVNVDVFGSVAGVVGSSPQETLVLLDISNPAHPVIKQSVPLPDGCLPTSVSISEEYVVVATQKKGLLIFTHNNWSLRPERSSK